MVASGSCDSHGSQSDIAIRVNASIEAKSSPHRCSVLSMVVAKANAIHLVRLPELSLIAANWWFHQC